MGQYYTIYNVTKKEYISPHPLNDGAKLLELNNTATALCILLANSNGRGGGDLNVNFEYDKNFKRIETKQTKAELAKIQAVAGRWAGDKIVVQGDYAEKGDPSYISKALQKAYTCINDIVIEGLSVDSYLQDQLKDR